MWDPLWDLCILDLEKVTVVVQVFLLYGKPLKQFNNLVAHSVLFWLLQTVSYSKTEIMRNVYIEF